MAKLTAPLMSLGARGTIGKTLVFASWKGIEFARRHVVPANPQTVEQTSTRNVFSMLNSMFKIMGTLAQAPWTANSQGRPYTNRNKFIQDNLPVLRGEVDMLNFLGSPGALAGLPPASVAPVGGIGVIDTTITAPVLPLGWTIAAGVAIAFPQQTPAIGFVGPLSEGEDLATPFVVSFAGLAAATYIVSGWFRFNRPDGRIAYGTSLQSTAVVT